MKKCLVLFIGLFVTACAQPRLSITYEPQTVQELNGAVKVNDFEYVPEEGVEQNEIRETAMGSAHLTEPVGVFISDAVRREFRQAGLSLKGNCTLDGTVYDFATDSLGFSVDYILDTRYLLKDRSNNELYNRRIETKFNASKLVQAEVVIANLNKLVSDNINDLLNDEKFMQNVKKNCESQT